LLIGSDALFGALHRKLIAPAGHQALPAMFDNLEFTTDGGLMSYGASISDAYRQAGIYAGRILSGTKPGELPVLQSSRFELVTNLKTAKALRIAVSNKLMALADEVIE
jgi:putative ABC transport system substrate-binding protein